MSDANDSTARLDQAIEAAGALFSAFCFVLLSVFNGSCTAAVTPGDHLVPLVRVAYSPGGDAPILTLMNVYEEFIWFGELGGQMSKRRVSSSELLNIRFQLAECGLEGLKTSPGVGRHERELWIEAGGIEIGILLDNPPKQLVPLLRALKVLFSRQFGGRFDHVANYFP